MLLAGNDLWETYGPGSAHRVEEARVEEREQEGGQHARDAQHGVHVGAGAAMNENKCQHGVEATSYSKYFECWCTLKGV